MNYFDFLDRIFQLYENKANKSACTYLKHINNFCLPYVYKEGDTNIRFEWDITQYYPTLSVDFSTMKAQYHNLNLEDDEDEFYELDLYSEDDWQIVYCLLFTLRESS